MTQKEKNIPKIINICGRKFELIEDKKINGGWFETYGNNGIGKICIGHKWKDKTFRFDVLCHETIESILTSDNKRYGLKNSSEEENFVFIFDHDYLEQFTKKIIDALLSCGAIEIKEF